MSTLVYEPDAGFFGTDSFRYTISNGSTESTGTITVHVTLPVHIDLQADDADADGQQAGLDADTYVDGGYDLGDDSIIRWRVVGPQGSLADEQTNLSDGIATNVLSTVATAGAAYTVYAKIIQASVDGGPAEPIDGPETAVRVAVIPGAARRVDFQVEDSRLPADGLSKTPVKLVARDAEGNLVASGTPVVWSVTGGASIVTSQDAIGVTEDEDGNLVGRGDGAASVTIRAGAYAGPVRVTATIDGREYGTELTILPLQFFFAAEGNAIAFGSGERRRVTVSVVDADGNPVADETPISWFTTKGSIVGSAPVFQGQATAYLYESGGSQVAGNGKVIATVGSRSGSTVYLFLDPPASANKLGVRAGIAIIAGDTTADGVKAVEQADGSMKPYTYHSGTTVTIRGQAGAVIDVRVGGPDLPASVNGLLVVTGDGGVAGPTATVTIGPDGTGTFRVDSTGTLPDGQAIVVPITGKSQLPWWDPYGYFTTQSTFEMGIVVAPSDFIAQAKDFGYNVLTGIATGDDSSVEGVVADIGFSLIPVFGAYTDLRDITKEMAKLRPGSTEWPNWVVVGFSIVGIAGSFLGPEVDWAPTVAKKLATLLRADGAIWKTVAHLVGEANVSKLGDLRKLLTTLVDPGGARLRRLADGADAAGGLVQDADQLARLGKFLDAFGDNADEVADLFNRLKQAHTLTGARKVLDVLGELKPSQIADIKAAGKLDEVGEAITRGMPQEKAAAFANWLDLRKTDPNASIPGARPKEIVIDDFLRARGDAVEPNLLASEWLSTPMAKREGDRIVNGIKTEYKTLEAGASAGTIKNNVGQSIKAGGQGRYIILDSRQTGLTAEEAQKGMEVAWKYSRDRLDKIGVILPDGRLLTYP